MASPISRQPVEAVRRALLILETLNRHKVVSVQMVHEASSLPKATIVRLLQTLCALGYVVNDRRHGGYTLTSRVNSLSYGFRGDPLVVEAARPWGIAFTQQFHWPIAITVLDGDEVAVRFSTIPDSPISPFHGTINMRLSLLGRALGRAYLAFCAPSERSMLLNMLAKSKRPEDALAHDRRHALWLLANIRRAGFAERDPAAQPSNSNTIAMPIFMGNKVLATVGMTYFTSALGREDLLGTYVPLIGALARNIEGSVDMLRRSTGQLSAEEGRNAT